MFFVGGIFCSFNIFLFSLVVTRNYVSDPNEILITTIANFEWNLYDVVMIIIAIRSTTAASGEGKRSMSVIYKIVNASDGKMNGRVGESDGFPASHLTFFLARSWWTSASKFYRVVSISPVDFSTTTGRCALRYDGKKFSNHFFWFPHKFQLISASAMYLVILIQFESALPKRYDGQWKQNFV